MPASENRIMASMKAIIGWVCDRPASSAMSSTMPLAAAHGEDAGEGAERHGHVDRHVDDHALDAGLGAGGEADQREADMADRGIGHQPLDVALADRGEGAEHHRGDRDEDDDLLPVGRDRRERLDDDADEQRHRRDLRRGGEEGGDRRRRALVDVGRPHVERHGRDLEGEAGERKTRPKIRPSDALPPLERRGDAGEAGLAGEAVDQRGAVEQHARGQRAEDEILQAGLGRAHRVRG